MEWEATALKGLLSGSNDLPTSGKGCQSHVARLGKTVNEAWKPDDTFLESMGIEKAWLRRWPNELSGGELQRFCIARALGPQTQFVIADEMSTMLDVITQAQIWKLLMDTIEQRNIGLMMVTHNMDLAKRVCSRIIWLEELNNL